jgi:hypothetical protein
MDVPVERLENRVLSIRGHRVIVENGVDVEPSIW